MSEGTQRTVLQPAEVSCACGQTIAVTGDLSRVAPMILHNLRDVEPALSHKAEGAGLQPPGAISQLPYL